MEGAIRMTSPESSAPPRRKTTKHVSPQNMGRELVARLKSDPVWAAIVLAPVIERAYRRWKQRRTRGKWSSIYPLPEAVPAAVEHACRVLPPDTQFNAVDTAVSGYIDIYMSSIADLQPYTPNVLDRGRKVRGRVPRRILSRAGLPSWMRANPVSAAFIIDRILEPKLRAGLTMLRAGEPLGDIRKATGLRGPDLQRGFAKWQQLLAA